MLLIIHTGVEKVKKLVRLFQWALEKNYQKVKKLKNYNYKIRSKWKGVYLPIKLYYLKFLYYKKIYFKNFSKKLYKLPRNLLIFNFLRGLKFYVYNGKKFNIFFILSKYFYYKFGSFFFTKKKSVYLSKRKLKKRKRKKKKFIKKKVTVKKKTTKKLKKK